MEKKGPTNRNAVLLLTGSAAAIWLGSFSGAANNRYELRTEVPVSYQSPDNTILVLDAYERLMNNYMSLVQTNLNTVGAEVSHTAKMLVTVDRKLDNLSLRLARIEQTLAARASDAAAVSTAD